MRTQLLEEAPNASSQATTPIAQIDPVPRVSIQAFCELADAASVIQAAIGDRRMSKAHVKQNMGGAAAAVEAYRNAPTPNVIVIEATADRDLLVEQLDELAQYCDAGTKVIIIGKVNDIVLYRQLIARGVSEYLVLPFGVVDFVSAVSQLFKTPGAKPLGRVISISAHKAASARRPSRTTSPGTLPRNCRWIRSSPTSTSVLGRRVDFNQDPPQGIAEAVFAPTAWTPRWSIVSCPNAATTSIFLPRRRCSIDCTTSAKRRSIR